MYGAFGSGPVTNLSRSEPMMKDDRAISIPNRAVILAYLLVLRVRAGNSVALTVKTGFALILGIETGLYSYLSNIMQS